MGSGEEHARRVEELERAGRERDHTKVPDLVEVLGEAKECWHTRTAAVRSLVQLGAAGSAPQILKLLVRDKDPDTREACIQALVHFRFGQARRALERIAASDDPLAARAREALTNLHFAV
jgi:HEAT repeat protein